VALAGSAVISTGARCPAARLGRDGCGAGRGWCLHRLNALRLVDVREELVASISANDDHTVMIRL
jgi:hypothetical protein